MKSNLIKILFFVLLFPSYAILGFAQNNKDSAAAFSMIKASFGLQFPGADLAKRFGYNSNGGLDFVYKTKHNIIIGASGSFLFGNQIREGGILDSIKTSSGFIIDQNGNPARVRLFERGYNISVYAGKIFPLGPTNRNSGIIVYGGPTYLRHKIKINDIGHQSPQLVDPYPNGYDRLSAGFGFRGFVGYSYLSKKRLINFFAGFEFEYAITKSLRGYNYDQRQADTALRTDILSGFRAGWILPLYRKSPQEFYYY